MSSKDDKGRLATFCQVPPGLKHPDSWLYFKSYDPIKDPLGITHGKEERWAEPGTFYHGDLAAGEATTTVQLALLLARSLTDLGAYDYSDFLNRSLFGTRAPQIARDHARPRGGQVRAAHDDPGGQPRHVPRGARAALLPRAPRRRGARAARLMADRAGADRRWLAWCAPVARRRSASRPGRSNCREISEFIL